MGELHSTVTVLRYPERIGVIDQDTGRLEAIGHVAEGRLGELSRVLEILVFCRSGQRA
jgi:hypothetical protein